MRSVTDAFDIFRALYNDAASSLKNKHIAMQREHSILVLRITRYHVCDDEIWPV